MSKNTHKLPSKYWFFEENEDSKKALQIIEEEAKKTSNPALYFLLGQDWGVYAKKDIQNYEKAYHYFKRGAEIGDASCIYECGIALMEGLGVENNNIKGLLLIKKAANLKNEMALQFLFNEEFQKQFYFQLSEIEKNSLMILLEKS
jgi:TPR repeat protein